MKTLWLNAAPRGHHALLLPLLQLFTVISIVSEQSTIGVRGSHVIDRPGVPTATVPVTAIVTDDTNTKRVAATADGTTEGTVSALVLVQQQLHQQHSQGDAMQLQPAQISEQFRQFITAYDIDLKNVSVEFDYGVGEYFFFVCFHTIESLSIRVNKVHCRSKSAVMILHTAR